MGGTDGTTVCCGTLA